MTSPGRRHTLAHMLEADDVMETGARQALIAFPVGSIQSVTRVRTGLIHRTFGVETGAGRYVLQRLHADLASDAMLADYEAVTAHLAEQNFPAPRLVKTSDGRVAADTPEGRYRLITFLPGVSHEEVRDERMAYEAAVMLGAYTTAMAEFRYAFKAGRPLHDSHKHYQWMRDAVAGAFGRPVVVRIGDMVRIVERDLPAHFLPEPLPSRVVHGDPKISNVLFDPASGKATGMVDLDSTARHTVLVDIGDAARSWCRSGPEDRESPFLIGRFRALCAGYRDAETLLSRREIEWIPQACRLITLELASRFLRDAIEDRYFGWDPARFASRVEHNIARARGCVVLYESMRDQAKAMEEVVTEVWRA